MGAEDATADGRVGGDVGDEEDDEEDEEEDSTEEERDGGEAAASADDVWAPVSFGVAIAGDGLVPEDEAADRCCPSAVEDEKAEKVGSSTRTSFELDA